MDRLKLTCDVLTSDAAAYKPEQDFPFILLDAPCSSTGTLRRHPDVSRARGPKDIAALAEIQARLLDAAVAMMPVGGILIYCVCSMQAEEGPDQIKALLDRNRTVKRKEISGADCIGFEKSVLDNGDVQTLPHHMAGGMDGFFISRLEKISQ
jgi:16S rRNA (cytosine967-C5)-methyltransferase